MIGVSNSSFLVMPGPTGPAFGRPEDKLHVPGIHVLGASQQPVDARDKPAHDMFRR